MDKPQLRERATQELLDREHIGGRLGAFNSGAPPGDLRFHFDHGDHVPHTSTILSSQL